MMKATYIKGLSLLTALLLSLSLLTACNCSPDSGDPAESTESDTPATVVTDAETDPPATEPAPLTEAGAKTLLASAMTASEAKTVYANTVHSAMSTEGVSMMDVSIYEASDGNGHTSEVKALGMSIAYVILDGKAYAASGVGDTYTDKYVVSLTDEQAEQVISTIVSGSMTEGIDISFMMTADAFVGLSGEQQADGSVLLTAADLTAEAKASMDGGDGSTVTITTCTMTVNADGLLTGRDLAATITIPETDFSAAMTMEMSVTQTTVYDNVTVTAPEDADVYIEESYEAVFEGTVPLNSMMEAAGMPLDSDSYTIGDPSSGADVQAQIDLLRQFPQLYADKTFTIYGTVTVDDVLRYLEISDGSVMLDYSEDVLGPLAGDVITATAKFEKVFNSVEDNDLSAYVFYFEAYEIVEREKGPNGGTYMFVDVNTSLNVRPMPTTAGNSPIGSFTRGEVVEVLEIVDGWAKIVFEEAENGYAYVSADYLSES